MQSYACKCPKGLAKCHHMIALLMWLLKNASRTDVECVWSQEQSRYIILRAMSNSCLIFIVIFLSEMFLGLMTLSKKWVMCGQILQKVVMKE